LGKNYGCTAERVGLYNFNRNIEHPESGVKDNPYGQWIGAQMRTDIWGLISHGMPDAAAEFAKRDACITHFDNGIYGAQYIAAMISLAITNNDRRYIVQQALKVIPEHCEYAKAVRDVIEYYDHEKDWRKAWKMVDDHYGWNDDGARISDFIEHYRYNEKTIYDSKNVRWVHAVPNGAMVVLALLYGNGDFVRP
jgi:ADP-ribosylglycohydrolase